MERENSNSFFKIKEELKNSEFDRTFSHWTAEEDEELISLHTKMRMSNLEIAKRHRRTVGSIKARLKLHGYPDKNPSDFAIQFANYLKHGINPITGEVLSEDSAWLHPKIISDLDDYNQKSRDFAGANEKIPDTIETILHERERTVFQSLFNQIEIFLPNITVRDAQLLKYLYSNVDRKITLQETADQFQISRERVRQIRDKALRKLNQSIRLKRYLQKNVSSSGYLNKQDALKYLNSILETLHSGNAEEYENPKTKNNHSNANPSLNVGKTWTEDEEAKLISKWKSGQSLEEIATQLGRLRGGIRSRLKRLGMLEEQTEHQELSKTSAQETLSNDQITLTRSEEEIIHLEIERKKFFRIENFNTFTPYSKKNKVTRDVFTNEEIKNRRIKNSHENRLLNYFFPITWEEVKEMKAKFEEGLVASDLENYFQRSCKSIFATLENEGFIVPAADEHEISLILSLYNSGQSLEILSKKFDRSSRSIELIIQSGGTSNSDILTTKNEYNFNQFLNEIDFFRIEKCETYTPKNPGYLANENGEFTIELIDKLRNANHEHGRLLNSGFPVTQEEINLILKFKQEQKTLVEMETFFQRSINSIRKIIEENNG